MPEPGGASYQPAPRRGWLIAVTVGCALVTLAMITVGLVLVDKPHFGWLVGSLFLQVISAGVMLGAILVLIGAWKLPQRLRWQGLTFMAWAVIALTSPAFGFLFLLPWGLLALSLPVIIAALVSLYKQGVPAVQAA